MLQSDRGVPWRGSTSPDAQRQVFIPCIATRGPVLFAGNSLARRGTSRHARRMATPLTVSIPHQLGRAEARRRIEAGFAQVVHLFPGGGGAYSERWEADRLTFGLAAMGQTVNGVIDVGDAVVTIVIELPGVLGLIANSLKDRLQQVGQLLLTKG